MHKNATDMLVHRFRPPWIKMICINRTYWPLLKCWHPIYVRMHSLIKRQVPRKEKVEKVFTHRKGMMQNTGRRNDKIKRIRLQVTQTLSYGIHLHVDLLTYHMITRVGQGTNLFHVATVFLGHRFAIWMLRHKKMVGVSFDTWRVKNITVFKFPQG
jgi:hypothetical protein